MPPRQKDIPDGVDGCGKHLYYCDGPGHNGRVLLPADQFYFIRRPVQGMFNETYLYRRILCKHCIYVSRSTKWQTPTADGMRDYLQHGRVPLSRMQGYLKELESRCGSVNAAAHRVGTSSLTYLRWQRRAATPDRANNYMMKESALKVLEALRYVRSVQSKGEVIQFIPWRKKDRCRGCGTDMDNYTLDCNTCWERITRRHDRGAISDEQFQQWRTARNDYAYAELMRRQYTG